MRRPLVLALLLLAGCTREEPRHPEASAMGDLGGDGALFASLGPIDWAALEGFPQELSRALPVDARDVEQALALARAEAGSAWGILRGVAARLRLGELPAAPPGLDAARPILLALGTPIALPEEQMAALAASVSDRKARRPSGLRHRIVLPASDAGALADALTAALPATDEHITRVTRRAKHVTVDLVVGLGLSMLDEAGRARALGPVDRAADGLSPLFTGGEASLARIHVRLDRLGDVGASAGATMIDTILAEPDIGVGPAEVMQGMAEILTAPLAVDPATRLFSDAVIDVPAAAPTHAALFLVATPRGQKVLAMDRGLASGKPTAPGQLDLALLSAAAPDVPHQMPGASAAELAESVHMCGWPCSVYYGFGNGLGFLRAFEAEEPGFLAKTATPVLARAAAGARLTLAGSVLVVEPMAPAEGALTRARTATPRAAAESPALACYLDALTALRRALLMAAEQSAETAGILDHVTTSEAEHLACAAVDPLLGQRVAALRAAIASLRAVRNSPHP
ncbi:MAG TPA: hypothetical protein VMZ28_07005 [Kofleriaceae bacterium]|nr:hypothetical protein [Kofleriaceae bacterium]